MRFFLFIVLLGLSQVSFAQVQVAEDTSIVRGDTTVVRKLKSNSPVREFESVAKEHSPTRAALLSAAIPGLGQAYNKKYWKIPIVWAGFGAFGYFIKWNNDQYQYYRRNLIYDVAGDPDYPNETGFDRSTLRSYRDYFRRNRDQLAIYGILFYVLQIVDAHVDAHLIEFDVNQDLSLRIEPDMMPVQYTNANFGLSLKLTF